MNNDITQNRFIAEGNFAAKNMKINLMFSEMIDNISKISTPKLNQISSILDQMTKLIEDILKEE